MRLKNFFPDAKEQQVNYSFVIPVNNEEENIPQLLRELDDVIKKLPGESEAVIVDDGSKDASRDLLTHGRGTYKWLHLVFFDKNYGQSAAFHAGIATAKGDAIITMDADLQNNPEDIFKLLEYFPAYDVVAGVRTNRNDSFIRHISSCIGNGFRNLLTKEAITDTGCSLKIFRASYIKKVPLFNGMHRFYPTLCRIIGARIMEVPVSHRPRIKGKSHYGISNRMFKGIYDVLAVRWMTKRTISYKIERID
jgi:dolichol-phosphate mannosyltransferase